MDNSWHNTILMVVVAAVAIGCRIALAKESKRSQSAATQLRGATQEEEHCRRYISGGKELSLIAIICLVLATVNLMHGLWSNTWPRTTGQIILATTGDQNYRDPTVRYQFKVNGENIVSDHIYAGANGNFLIGSKQNVARKYLKEQTTAVFYNPLYPQDSALEPGPHEITWMAFIGIFLLHQLGQAFISVGREEKQKLEPNSRTVY